MSIEDIKNELKPRDGLMAETLEKAASVKPRGMAAGAVIIAACALVCLGAIAAVLLKAPKEPDGSTAAEETAQPAAVDAEADPTPARPDSEGQYVADLTVYKLIDESPVIFEGVCGKPEYDTARFVINAEFTVKRVIRGELHSGESVPVRADEGNELREGETFLVLAEPVGSIFEGMELFYNIAACFGERRQTELQSILEDTRGKDYGEVIGLVAEYAASHEYSGDGRYLGLWCASDDVEEALGFADCAVEVRVSGVQLDSIPDRTTYLCSVAGMALKGEAEGSIRVVSFKHSMQTGKEYVLLLTKTDGIYVVCSPVSVMEAGSAGAEKVIKLTADN